MKKKVAIKETKSGEYTRRYAYIQLTEECPHEVVYVKSTEDTVEISPRPFDGSKARRTAHRSKRQVVGITLGIKMFPGVDLGEYWVAAHFEGERFILNKRDMTNPAIPAATTSETVETVEMLERIANIPNFPPEEQQRLMKQAMAERFPAG